MELNLSSTPSVDKQIMLLERRLEREKSARLQAEELLVAKSREIYHSNVKLKAALAESEAKRDELAFILQTSGSLTVAEKSENLVTHCTELSANFLQAEVAICGVQLVNNLQFEPHTPVYTSYKKWHHNKNLITEINVLLKQQAISEAWLKVPVSLSYFSGEPMQMVVANTTIDSESRLLSVFLLKQLPASPDTFNALTVIQRQLKNLLLARKTGYQEVDEVLDLSTIQQQLEQAQKMLVRSEKMTLLGQLAAGIAHEINNPVGFVRSNTEVLSAYMRDVVTFIQQQASLIQHPEGQAHLIELKQKLDIDFIIEDIQDIVASNLDGVDRITEIVQSLKTFSHQGDKAFSKVDLKAVIDSALLVTKNELKYKHQVNNHLTEEALYVMGKPGQLQQVFINLFVNAAQAMTDGGCVEIVARRNQSEIQIDIIDTGCGMDEITKQHLFTPFYTTKSVGEGTGLGLSISIGIIEAHNAEIHVKSEQDKGTTFTLIFPEYTDTCEQ